MKTEFKRAKEWRLARGLTVPQLAELTGYARESIYLFERGIKPPTKRGKPTPVSAWVWLRFKRACQGVEWQLRSTESFGWDADIGWGQ